MRICFYSKMIKTITTIICLVVVLISSVLGCGKKEDVVFPTALGELSLVQVWNKVLEITDVQEQTADFRLLSLTVTDDSTLDLSFFDFFGLNAKGKIKYYQANLGPRGILVCYSEDSGNGSEISSNSPLLYFEELDKVDWATIGPPRHIDMEFYNGDLHRTSANYFTMYQLEDGNLIPLKEIVFHTNTPIGVMQVYYNSTKTQTWFITEDIDKAATVEYLET